MLAEADDAGAGWRWIYATEVDMAMVVLIRSFWITRWCGYGGSKLWKMLKEAVDAGVVDCRVGRRGLERQGVGLGFVED